MQSITDNENEIFYAYNGDGNRISKTVNGTKTEFIYNGDILAGQKSGDDKIVFMYDNNSDIFGFIYNDTEYYYIKNAQNDVIGITDADNNVLVKYTYDPWGKVGSITSGSDDDITNLEDDINQAVLDLTTGESKPVLDENGNPVTSASESVILARINPILYRSYYYDKETEWYYLKTRYYFPDMCRFINSDNYALPTATPTELTDKNLFAYCDNNPINRVDDEGTFWNFVIGGVVGAAVSAASAALSGGDAKSIALSAVTGAIGGVIGASGLGIVGQIAAGAILSGGSNLANQTLVEGKSLKTVDWLDVGIDTVVGGVTAAVSSKIMEPYANSAKNTIDKGMYRYLKGEQRLIKGDRYYKGSMKRGLEIMNGGFKQLNTVRGKSSVIGSSFSGFLTGVKNTFKRWFRR